MAANAARAKMKLVLVSYKVCWESPNSASGYATNGGFALQVRALSELFDETRLVVPIARVPRPAGEVKISGRKLSVVPIEEPVGKDLPRKFRLPGWFLRNITTVAREIRNADAVHTPVPGDIGSIGMLVAMALRKRLFIRYCGNWLVRRTIADRFLGWLLQRVAGSRTVVLTTGGGGNPPSLRNSSVRWIFATSLTESELEKYATVRADPAPNGPKLIIACRQETKKGTGRVIESLRLLEGDYPGITFDVVGDGSALPEFREMAKRLKVADRVRFFGNVDHTGVMELLTAADIFCFPTTASEGFPKAVLEALACGLPVVSTRVSILAELLSDGGGVLLDDTSPSAIALAIRSCLDDRERYRALSSAAVRTASRYSLERWRDTIGSLLVIYWGPLRSLHA